MNIKGTREQFLNCLQKVSPAAMSGSINPILSNVLLKAEVDSVDIIAGDQETQIKAPCQVNANKKFNATVSAKKFQDILRQLDADGEVSFDYQEGKGENKQPAINISSGKTRYKLSTLSASDFPRLGEKTSFKPFLKLAASELLRSLKRVSYSSAINSHRLNLNGVLLESSNNGLRVVATDGHRMAVQVLTSEKAPEKTAEKADKAEKTDKADKANKADKASEEKQLILPRKSVIELIRNLPAEGDSEIQIKTSDQFVRFIGESFELTSSIITDSFPDYASVIPRNNDKKIAVVSRELLSGLNRVAAVADRGATIVMNFDKNKAVFECVNQDNETATDEIPTKYTGDKIEIGFNVDYLTEMLTAVDDESFEIRILDSSSSVLVVPTKDDPDFQYIVMPVRL